jgi:hypothetical protein
MINNLLKENKFRYGYLRKIYWRDTTDTDNTII